MGKWLLAVTGFEVTNHMFNIKDENNSFATTTPERWIPEGSEEIVDKFQKLLELRSENDIELHVQEVGRRGTRT